jgi:hypothetical protein
MPVVKPISHDSTLPAGAEMDMRTGTLPTRITPRAARLLVGVFLLLIFGLPMLQTAWEWSQQRPLGAGQLLARFQATDAHRFETELARQSYPRTLVQPWVQYGLTSWGGFGNDQVVVGRDGWLFYQPGLDFVSGYDLTDPGRLRARQKKMRDAGEWDWQADPRPAILRFHQDCLTAGVRLVLVPIPDKAGMQPAQLSPRLAAYAGSPLTNHAYQSLLTELRQQGVEVFDPTPKTTDAKEMRYLRQDTHWTPEYMTQVATDLARYLALPGERRFGSADQVITHTGDLVEMLGLPATQTQYPPQTVTIQRVRTADGADWQPTPHADILLLGDSFTNIYTDGAMGWGTAAGFGPQLARAMGRELDVVARNGAGASATRAELARRPQPFAGKKVIIWQFAARELAVGNWQVVPIAAGPTTQPATQVAKNLTLTAELLTAPPALDVSATPYKNAVTILKFRVTQVQTGSFSDAEILVSMPLMRDRQLLPVATYQPRRQYRLELTPDEPAEVRSWPRLDRSEGDLGPVFWARTCQMEP